MLPARPLAPVSKSRASFFNQGTNTKASAKTPVTATLRALGICSVQSWSNINTGHGYGTKTYFRQWNQDDEKIQQEVGDRKTFFERIDVDAILNKIATPECRDMSAALKTIHDCHCNRPQDRNDYENHNNDMLSVAFDLGAEYSIVEKQGCHFDGT